MASKLAPYLSYADAPAAIAWLEAIGFIVVVRQDGPDGRVTHSELRMDEVVVMLASDDSDYVVAPLVGRSTGAGLYVVVDDVDRLYAAAVNAGGASVFRPRTLSGAQGELAFWIRAGGSGALGRTNPESDGRRTPVSCSRSGKLAGLAG